MSRLGVLGWPVAHSRSPAMHNAALAAVGLDGWRYQRLPVPPHLFAETVHGLPEVGFLGANVTIPHKAAALALSVTAGDAAREIGAANTLTFAKDGSIAAENTDGPGLLAALGEDARGHSALVLGAGGSARAAVWALQRAGAREVAVWNRTPGRARELADALGARAVETPAPADLLVNCTSVGLAVEPQDPSSDAGSRGQRADPLERSATQSCALNQLGLTFDQVGEYSHVVDLVYRPGSTPLIAAARAHGVRTLDGLEILVAQGALSFELWTGRPAPVDEMRRAARAG
ncbi:MAG TPA: shikimate dehydrogenase [Solirubrobacteraceae bacterium]|jgi:shikimate dehydrogenase|nr:shikimate dehydrogenase [Solirubrobacteraceae bacterium]